jgi:photosystem II protein
LQGYGVYRYESKYGANVDGYSPIYTPDQWTDDGQVYKLGTKGLLVYRLLLQK